MANKTEIITIRVRESQLKEWRKQWLKEPNIEDLPFSQYLRQQIDKGIQCTGHKKDW